MHPRISQPLEADVGGNLEKIGRKAKLSSDLKILGFWENSFYSSFTLKSVALVIFQKRYSPIARKRL
jgi:hypothetical protein